MSELILMPYGEAPTNPSLAGAPSSAYDMVFVYVSTFNSVDGTFTDGDLGVCNGPNRNYVKRM